MKPAMRLQMIRAARGALLSAAAATLILTPGEAAAQAADPGEVLTANLRILANDPDNFNALIAAGNAAVDVGDFNSAAGLFGRAAEEAPSRAEPQAGMGRVMVNMGDPVPAMSYFNEAVRRGGDLSTFAVDRGLAKDLLGDLPGAQADYRMGLGRADDAKARRRLALSLAIQGERTAALAFLQPLINSGDPAARRSRAFVLALTGDLDGARNAIEREMPGASRDMEPFLRKLSMIMPAQKAAAVHLGLFPDASEIQMAERPAPPVTAPVNLNRQPTVGERRRVEREEIAPTVGTRSEVTMTPIAPATTAAPVAPVNTVTLPPAQDTDLSSDVQLRNEGRSGERLASIDDLLQQPAASTPPPSQPRYETPPPSRPKFEASPQPKVEQAPPPPKPKPAPPKPDIGTEGTWWVQVAGGSRQDGMSREWRRVQGEAGSLLNGQTPHVTHGRDYFRLLVGPFSTRDKAQELTNKLRGNGIDVFTYKRSPDRLKITPL